MHKIILLLLLTTMALISDSTTDSNQTLNIKNIVKTFIDTLSNNQDQSLMIKNRNITSQGESFFFIVPNKELNIPDNISIEQLNNQYSQYLNLYTINDINYTATHFSVTSSIVPLQKESKTQTLSLAEQTYLMHKFMYEKAITLYGTYDTDTNAYSLSLKDINLSIKDKIDFQTKNIQLFGFYNPYNILSNKSTLNLGYIHVVPPKSSPGEYITLKDATFSTYIEENNSTVNAHTSISIGNFDINAPSDIQMHLKGLDLNITFGNLDLETYKEISEKMQKYSTTMQEDEINMLSLKLLSKSKNLFIEISNFSTKNFSIDNQEFGSFKLNSKISLTSTQDLLQLLMTSPESILTILKANAHLEFSEELLKNIYKVDKSVASFISLFANYKKNDLIFDITLKDTSFIVNNKVFNLDQFISLPTNLPHTSSRHNSPKIDGKYGQTALHKAVKADDINKTINILNENIDIDFPDKLGRTALHYAAFNGNIEIAKILLNHHANIDAIENVRSWSPLFFAVFMGHKKMKSFLIQQGANKSIKDRAGKSITTYEEK